MFLLAFVVSFAMAEDKPIAVTNYEYNETIRYPLVLLRGDLKDTTLTRVTAVNESSKMDSSRMEGLASQGRFKVFAELVPGKNNLTVKTDKDSIAWVLNYKPQTNPYKVRAVHFTDNTGNPSFENQTKGDQDYRARWDAALKLMQTYTADWMNERGYGRRTFNLEFDENGKVIVHIVKAERSFDELQKLDGMQAYGAAGRAIRNQLPKGPYKNLVTVAWSRHNPETGKASGYAALGGGGVSTMGGACFYTWPAGVENIQKTFMSDVQIDTEKFHSDGGEAVYRTAANTLGAALHELGHAFGLPHTNPQKKLGNAIMFHGYLMNRYAAFADPPWKGNKFQWRPFDEKFERENTFLAPVSCAALAPTRYFALDERDYTQNNTIRFSLDRKTKELVVASDEGLKFVCVELPGKAEKWEDISAMEQPPKEIRITFKEIGEYYKTTDVTVRAVDAMGHLRNTKLPNLLNEK